MSSRDLILARVRRALAGVPDVEITRAYRGPARTPGEIRLFEERVRDYRAVVHVVDEAGTAGRVARSLAGRGARRVVVPGGFPSGWLAAADVEAVADDPPLSAADLDAVDGVLTTCAVAIAETGTIVLDTGPGQGRRALTLVPDYHLCVVRAAQIVAGVPDAVARLDPARPLTWISGPSATSDIELNRVEGVHGPRTLEVLIVT
ncbi:LutC/YkgG family protein [Microbispora sp. CA-102843]|uniref:LutC/YkgG family protein n=1 Tax=Microbispora sp. CA-102843 TaxID=3239952 RepID=UPI003D930895